MSLPASGTITLGQVNVELGRASTAAINMNEAVVRFTFNVPSGAISMSNGYGKSASFELGIFYAGATNTRVNTVTRINSSAALVGSETNVGTIRESLAGASVAGNGLFYGGRTSGFDVVNTVTRINSSGALVGSETSVGTIRDSLAGATVGGNGMFYAGSPDPDPNFRNFNTVTRINSSGALVGSQTSIGQRRRSLAGAPVGGNGLFYSGFEERVNQQSLWRDTVTRINSSGALVGSETNVGTARRSLGGAAVAGNGIFFAGTDSNFNFTDTVTRINSSGALVGSQTNIGSGSRESLAGAAVGGNGMFYGGVAGEYEVFYFNTVTRINSSGALVGSQTSVGTARSVQGGAGVL